MPKRVLEEVAGHRGIRAVFGDQYDSMLDGVYRDFFETEEFREVIQRYFRGRELESVADQRYATEEFLAHNARMRPELKPAWWQSFLERIKMALRKLPGFHNLRFTDRELERILIRGIGAVRKGKSEGNAEGGTRFSIIGEEGAGRGREAEKRPYYQIPFSEGLARVVDPAQKDKREPVFVCTTPEIMRKIGFTALPIMMNARHLRLNYYTAEEFRENYGKLHKEDHAHGLHEALKTLPKVLEHPLAVVVNMTENAKPGSVVVITDMDIGGKKVVVPVLIETVSNTNKGDIDSHLVLTVYDSKDWINTFLKPALEEEKKNRVGIFYFDEKKASRYSVLSKNKKTITAGYLHTIHDEWSPVKGEFKKQTETLQFKEWFGKSKVVDEEGKPLVVYHGSTADFTEFSYKFANRNGQADGRGFYFTDNRSFAEGYQNKDGKLFEVYLSIQKPLNPDKLTITKAELRKILDAIDPSGDYMTNYAEDDRGYPGAAWRAKALNSTVNAIYDSSENNADILAELYGSFGGGEVLAEVRKVSGYDGFIKKDQNGNMIYIAFEPGQIKSATDNIGTYDRNNPDIRFSIEQYSDADWSDMVTYLKAKVGNLLTKPDGEYKKILEDAGMECYSEADAHACAVEAMNANLKDAQARRKAEMMNWIVENNAWIQRISEVTGSPEFKIRPSYRFQGMDFTGSYISREWRDCSGNPKAKNREKRLKEASGYHSDELAQMIADKYGGDAIEIENDLIEYFQHKKKKASKTERENGELGVYDEYYAFKKEERLFNRELDRQLQKQWEAQEARIGDEIKDILEEKRVIGEELAETDFDLFASLYQQVTGERAPAHPSAEQLDALNAAIQEGGVTQAYIRGWEAGRDRMLAEKRKEFAEFTAKVMQEKAAMKEHYKERIAKEREKRREQAEKFSYNFFFDRFTAALFLILSGTVVFIGNQL